MSKLNYIIDVLSSCMDLEQLDVVMNWGVGLIKKEDMDQELAFQILNFNYNRMSSRLSIDTSH